MAGPALVRIVGTPGAVLLGLGSIVGTGVFVSLGIAAGIAGPGALIAVALAAVLASCNGLSSAQLAASHPVSGGTYAYATRYLTPSLGFVAGWLFLCAKAASAATAALGLAGYLLTMLDLTDPTLRTVTAVAAVLAITLVVAGGITRSTRVNTVIVTVTLLGLVAFVVIGAPPALAGAGRHLGGLADVELRDLLHASALMFVAFTGYGRIATLGEEVRAPSRTIPRAIVIALLASAALYLTITWVAVGAVGAPTFAAATHGSAAPLVVVAELLGRPDVGHAVAVAAITAMAGVLLNLVLGLSRVALAMARGGDLPPLLGQIEAGSGSPRAAVLATGALIAALAAIGSVRATWSFSAFTVLAYYAITNLAALRLPAEHRRYPRAIAVVGLSGCLGLAFWVKPRIWLVGLAVIAVGFTWRATIARRWRAAA